MDAAAELGRNPVSKHQMEMSRLTRDGTTEPVSRDQLLRHVRGQGNMIFPCSADHEQDWQPYPVDPYSCYMCDHMHTYILLQSAEIIYIMLYAMHTTVRYVRVICSVQYWCARRVPHNTYSSKPNVLSGSAEHGSQNPSKVKNNKKHILYEFVWGSEVTSRSCAGFGGCGRFIFVAPAP